MKGAITLLAVLVSASVVLQPVIGAAVPMSADIQASPTAVSRVSRVSAKSTGVSNNRVSSAARGTGSKATGTAIAGGKTGSATATAGNSNESGTSIDESESQNKTEVKGDRLPDCKRDSYGGMNEDAMMKLWWDSGAEQYADKW